MHVNISQLVESLVPVLTIAMKKHCLIILVGTLVLLGPVADAATLYDYYDLEISGSGSSGEGSSSGSGSSGDTEEGQCVRPQPLPDPPSPQDDPVLTEIRCHVGCLDRIIGDEIRVSEASLESHVWPTVPDSILEHDCNLYQKVQECRSGCVTHSKSLDMTLNRCGTVCENSCRKDCESDYCDQRETRCLRRCNKSDCALGCLIFEEDVAPNNEDLVPPAPVQPPKFIIPEGNVIAGLYNVDANNTAPMNVDIEPLVTSFIFRVVHIELNRFAFYWLHSFEDMLSLEAFACEEGVLIQFAPVNKYGRSKPYSPSDILNVYGENRPPTADNPEFIWFNVGTDTRFGFWKHALITVSWQRPRGFQYLDHYVVIVSSNTVECGGPGKEIIVHKQSTSAIVQADTPTEGPVNGCTYLITVTSRSMNQGPMEPPPEKPVPVIVDNPVPLNFECRRIWNGLTGTFKFDTSWTIPNSSYILSAIKHFGLTIELIEEDMHSPSMENLSIPFNTSQVDYSFLIDVDFPSMMGPNVFYSIKLTSHAVSQSATILIPDPHTCTLNAEPIPPSPIENITIVSENYTQQINVTELELSFVWTLPIEDVYISSYNVRIVEGMDTPDGVEIGDELYFDVIEPSMRFISVILPLAELSSTEGECIYLQIRSVSNFTTASAVSEWSQPSCIRLPQQPASSSISSLQPTSTSATLLPSPSSRYITDTTSTMSSSTAETPSRPSQSKDEGLPQYLYIVVACGGIVFLATLIVAMFVCLACIQNRKADKRSLVVGQPNIRKKRDSPQPRVHYYGGNAYPVVTMDEWEIHPNLVIVDGRLGEGAFGDVFQGTVRGMMGFSSNANVGIVAIKLLKATASFKERQNFLNHIQQAKRISTSGHAHLVKIIGCVTVHEPVCLIAEYPEEGDLLSYLEECRNQLGTVNISKKEIVVQGYSTNKLPAPYMEPDGSYSHLEPENESVLLQAADLLSFAIQITSGMEHLASLGIIHGDLACRNVYISDINSKIVKISDFGLSRNEEGVYARTITGRLPLRWMAVESISHSQFSSASDVWAFGITLWEIMTLGGFPYSNMNNRDILSALKSGYRMECPENCSEEIYSTMAQCWDESAVLRPQFSTLRQTLHTMFLQGDCHNLVKLEINERKTYYRRRGGHERLHRVCANTLPVNHTQIREQVQNVTPYTDHLLPKSAEEESSSSECTNEAPSNSEVKNQDGEDSDQSSAETVEL